MFQKSDKVQSREGETPAAYYSYVRRVEPETML